MMEEFKALALQKYELEDRDESVGKALLPHLTYQSSDYYVGIRLQDL